MSKLVECLGHQDVRAVGHRGGIPDGEPTVPRLSDNAPIAGCGLACFESLKQPQVVPREWLIATAIAHQAIETPEQVGNPDLP